MIVRVLRDPLPKMGVKATTRHKSDGPAYQAATYGEYLKEAGGIQGLSDVPPGTLTGRRQP